MSCNNIKLIVSALCMRNRDIIQQPSCPSNHILCRGGFRCSELVCCKRTYGEGEQLLYFPTYCPSLSNSLKNKKWALTMDNRKGMNIYVLHILSLPIFYYLSKHVYKICSVCATVQCLTDPNKTLTYCACWSGLGHQIYGVTNTKISKTFRII